MDSKNKTKIFVFPFEDVKTHQVIKAPP